MTRSIGSMARRATVGISIALIAIVGLLLLAILFFSLPPVQDWLLAKSLDKAVAGIPGVLSVRDASWRFPATIRADGLLWRDGADTLLAATRLRLSAGVFPLIRRDVRISEFSIEDLRVDVPAIQARLGTAGADTVVAQGPPEGRRFPRQGSLRGVPSVAIEQLRVTSSYLYIAEGVSLTEFDIGGGLDFRYGKEPRVRLERLTLRAEGDRLSLKDPGLDSAAFDIDISKGAIVGTASGQISQDIPFVLNIVPDGLDAFRLLLTHHQGEAPPEHRGVLISGKLIRLNGAVAALQYEALLKTPGSRDLSSMPPLAGRFENLPALEGLLVASRGVVEFQNGFAALIEADINKNSWIEGGGLKLAYRAGSLAIDSLSLSLPDLDAQAQAWLTPDSLIAEAAIHATGTRWIDIFRPEADIADSLTAGLFAIIEGARTSPRIQSSLELSARKGDFVLDRLSLRGVSPGEPGRPMELKLSVEAKEMTLATSAELELPSEGARELSVSLTPIVIQDISGPNEGGIGVGLDTPGKCTIKYDHDKGDLRADGLRVTGALGDLLLDASARRGEHGDFALESAGKLSLQTQRILSSRLPSEARFDDLGPIRGAFRLGARSGGAGADLDLSLDLSSTDWIDSGYGKLAKRGDRIEIDTLAVDFEGLDLALAGSVTGDVWDVGASMNLADSRLLKRLLPSLDEDVVASLSGRADFSGTLRSPRLNASLAGGFETSGYQVPAFSGNASWDATGLAISFVATDGLTAGSTRLENLAAKYETGPEGLFPGTLALEADGPMLGLRYSGAVDKIAGEGPVDDRGSGGDRGAPIEPVEWRIQTDELLVELQGRDLRTVEPFDLRVRPGEKLLHVTNLNMQGSLGKFKAGGYAGPDKYGMSIEALLSLPEEPPHIFVPEGLWPREVGIQFLVSGVDSLEASVDVKGLAIGDRKDLRAHIEASSVTGGIETSGTVFELDEAVLRAEATLPAKVRVYPPAASLYQGSVLLDVEASGFPLPIQVYEGSLVSAPERTARLDARVRVCGDAHGPAVYANADIGFPNWPKMKEYRLSINSSLAPDPSSAGTPCENPLPGEPPTPELIETGVAAALRLEGPKGRMASGTLVYPLDCSLAPLDFRAREGTEMSLVIESGDLDLADFDDFLPPSFGLEGRCAFNLNVAGQVNNPSLEGLLTANKMKVSTHEGSRVTSSSRIELAGTRREPSLTGKIEVHNGVILIPDRPKDLHPADGNAALWELDGGTAGVDSTGATDADSPGVAGGKPESGPETANAGPKTSIDLDVAVVIPAGLWIRGRGLEVEMAGDLRLVQKGDLPAITGDLKAVRGRLIFLGRTFAIERGAAAFYGGDEINPSLDLVLATNVGEIVIKVLFGGTAKKPELKLISDPELPVGDIMSLLVFGRMTDELDNDQVDLLGRRATNIAAAFGTGKLEAKLAQQLGVDMIRIGGESSEGGGSSLVIGKYISPKVLLKYEQVLEDRTRFFVNLEYFLTRHFKVETLIGHQSQSAVEFNWTSDY